MTNTYQDPGERIGELYRHYRRTLSAEDYDRLYNWGIAQLNRKNKHYRHLSKMVLDMLIEGDNLLASITKGNNGS